MKNGNCTECDKPLFDQNPDGESQLCDACFEELVEEEPADVCEYCKGDGKIPKLILDTSENMPSGGEWVDSGELEDCICKIEK